MFDTRLSDFTSPETTITLLLETLNDYSYASEPDVIKTHLRYYVLPRLMRNKTMVDAFFEPWNLFEDCAESELLKECDLSDFILRCEDEFILFTLAKYTSGYQMSDEAAWRLLDKTADKDWDWRWLEFNSVWFRRFQNEDYSDHAFRTRLKDAFQKMADHAINTGGKPDNRWFAEETIALSLNRVLNFHLDSEEYDVEPTKHPFSFNLSSSYNASNIIVNRDVVFWVLNHLPEVSTQEDVIHFAPVIVYSNEAPVEVKKKWESLARGKLSSQKYVTRSEYMIWKEFLTTDEFAQFASEYRHLAEAYIDKEYLKNLTPAKRIDFLIKIYDMCIYSLTNTSRVKAFEIYLKRHLENEFEMKIERSTLEQLLSIYRTSKESVYA